MNKKLINKTKGYKYKNNILIMSSDNESDNESELSSPVSFTTEENKSDKDESEENTADEEEDEIEESCYSCGSYCKKISVVCGDCGVKMCKQCARNACDNDNSSCGCYGNCSNCNKNINRGDHNWPCRKCNEWYCGELCRKTSNCDDCEPKVYKIDKDAYIEVVANDQLVPKEPKLEEKIKKLEKKLQNIKNIIN